MCSSLPQYGNLREMLVKVISTNFEFLADHDAQLVRYAALAERFFADDPNTSLIKVRQFAELLASLIAARRRVMTIRRVRFPMS